MRHLKPMLFTIEKGRSSRANISTLHHDPTTNGFRPPQGKATFLKPIPSMVACLQCCYACSKDLGACVGGEDDVILTLI